VRESAEERDNRLKGRNIGGGGAGFHGVQVNVSTMQDNEEVLVSCRRFAREAPGQIGGSPLGSVEKERLSSGGSRGSEETGANSGMRERSGGVLFVPLSFLVFLVLERRGEAARQDGGGIRRVDAMPFLSWSR
jgi:hypothetical protein